MRNENNDWILAVILNVATKLRADGSRIGTSDIVKAYQLAQAYSQLTNTELTRDDLAFILLSAFTTARINKDDIADLISETLAGKRFHERYMNIISEIERDIQLLGAKPGSKVSRKRITRSKSINRSEAIAAYYRLKRIGAIRGTPGKERIMEKHRLRNLALSLAKQGAQNLDDAVRKKGIPSKWDELLDALDASYLPEKLRELSERRLIALANIALKKHDKRALLHIAEELARRLREGYRIKDATSVMNLLERAELLTPSLRKKLASSSPLAIRSLTYKELLEVISSLDIEKGGELLASSLDELDERSLRNLLLNIDPRLLWRLPKRLMKRMRDPSLEAAYFAAKAFREAQMYLEYGEEGRADSAFHYIQKAQKTLNGLGRNPNYLLNPQRINEVLVEAKAYLSLSESLSGEPRGEILEGLLKGLNYYEKIRVLRSAYRKANSEWSSIILKTMERLLYRLSSREGLRLLPLKYRSVMPPGRVDVRRSVYLMIRNESRPIVYIKRKRSSRLSLALDMSGSMLEYSAWATAIASIFPHHLERLVLFTHKAKILEGPFTRREFAKILLEADFKGYTNVSLALREVSKTLSRRIVVISDLKQTVDDEPVNHVVLRIVKSGKRIVFIVPRNHDVEMRQRIESSGGKIIVAQTPRNVAQTLLRLFTRP